MNGANIDKIPVSQLPDRYRLARSAVYTRMDALGIKPQKVGNRAFINSDQLRLMDELHQFLQREGASTAEFLEMRGLSAGNGMTAPSSSGMSSGLSRVTPELVSLVSMVVSELLDRMQLTPSPPERLRNYRELEDAARHGWLLRTSDVAYLLEIPEAEVQRQGDRFKEAGFVFTRMGYRVDGALAWRVTKA
ncbi:hypothetical protein [Halomicronema hongdechloris]|nr:hypothetical protein [Halomicronema hongdechloris]